MGLKSFISYLLSFTRVTRNGSNVSDVKVDPGGGANVTAQHFASPGDDSWPLENDYVCLVPTQRENVNNAVGYVDPVNEPVAQRGEKRIYARDADGAPVVETHLKNTGERITFNSACTVIQNPDGSVKIFNDNGSIELKADGSTEITNTSGVTMQNNIDGTFKAFNGAGFINLLASGIVNINSCTIAPTGILTTSTGIYADSLKIDNKELKDHTHSGVSTGGANTGTNN